MASNYKIEKYSSGEKTVETKSHAFKELQLLQVFTKENVKEMGNVNVANKKELSLFCQP